MKISVFGLGYVGCVNIACLSDMGHDIIGVDIDSSKIDLINKGIPTIKEKELDDTFKVNKNFIKATDSFEKAILETDLSLICIGTPSKLTGELDLSSIYKVIENIGSVLSEKDSFHVIAIRSTVMPGTVRNHLIPILEKSSSKKIGEGFEIIMNPEFLREGKAVDDFFSPPYILFGLREENESLENFCRGIYKTPNSLVKFCKLEEAEIIKMVNNSWHALKIVFANEISNICRENQIDSDNVMDLFKADTQLNISSKYLSPGFAYGGSCLPKDLRALSSLHSSKNNLFQSVEVSNETKIKSIYREIKQIMKFSSSEKPKILFLGVSFKEGTDDVRMSPAVTLINEYFMKDNELKFELMVHDRNVRDSIDEGINSKFLIPLLGKITEFLVDDLNESIERADIIVFVNREKYYSNISKVITEDHIFIELSNFGEKLKCQLQRKLY